MDNRNQKKIIVSVTNDLVADNRVHKVCTTLTGMGFNVLLIGRKLPNSLPLQARNYSAKRFRLLFKKGPLFYLEFNLRLYCFLLFSNFDILLSNDLDTLPANFLISKFLRKPIVYDSHEYFTEVPELIHRPAVKKTWERMEQKMLPHIKHAYTVCESIAKVYTGKYGTPFQVVRNVPQANHFKRAEQEQRTEKIILYQGAVNIGRGLEQAILAMKYISNAKLIIAGDGDIKTQLEKLAETENLQNKVEFTGRLPLEDLTKLTLQADLGLSIEEDLGLNYRFALPNKLFDYIQAQVPVLVTNLPEMATIVKKYNVGEVTSFLEPNKLAEKITEALNNRKKRIGWKQNLETAARKLTWENEEKVLQKIFAEFL